MAGDPKVPEHELTAQGQIYRRASDTDEKVPGIAPAFRGTGATPEEKEDPRKPWISPDNSAVKVPDHDKEASTPPHVDTYARELKKRLGPLIPVLDKVTDGLEAAVEKVSGSTKSVAETAGETKNAAAATASQYTQAAWEKVNDLKPTLGGANEPAKGDVMESTLKQQMPEIAAKDQYDASAIAEKAKEKTASTPDVAPKLVAKLDDDPDIKVLADGESPQEDPLKAYLRVSAKLLV